MTSSTDLLALIPARYGSTRFPGKPLADIGGRSMIRRVFEQVSQATPLVAVCTDDARIARHVRQFGGRAVLTSERHTSGTDRCAEALALIEAEEGRRFDVVLNIQGDEPFIAPEQVRLLADAFRDPDVRIATLARPADRLDDILNPNKPKVVADDRGNALYFSREPIPHVRGLDHQQWVATQRHLLHIGLYGYRANTLRQLTKLPPSSLEQTEKLEQLRWLQQGYPVRVLLTTHESLSVDAPADIEELHRRGLF